MKASRLRKILGIVFLGVAAIAVSGIAPATEGSSKSFSLKDLPPIALENCIEVQKLLTRNPFSRIPNDYLLVTKYEEKSEDAGGINKGLIPGRALNIYLLRGVLLSKNHAIGIVHDSVLIVKISTVRADASGETVREWILIDSNGDRHIDKGIFRETVQRKGKSPIGLNEVAIPKDRLQRLQAYYEKAAMTLDARAAEGFREGCVTT
jgi:hypothetical protein